MFSKLYFLIAVLTLVFLSPLVQDAAKSRPVITDICDAISGRDLKSVEYILSVDPGAATRPFKLLRQLVPPICFATQGANDNIIRTLLKHGADVNSRHFGDTSLHIALMGGAVPTVQLLLENGADTTLLDRQGRSPAAIAAMRGLIDIVKLFDKNGVPLYNADPRGRISIHLAAAAGHTEVVRYLLHRDPTQIEAEDKYGWNILHFLTMSNQDEVFLTDYWGLPIGEHSRLWSLINNKTVTSKTPLMLASARCNKSVVKWLLRRGAESKTQDHRGWTALEYLRNRDSRVLNHIFDPAYNTKSKESPKHSSEPEEIPVEYLYRIHIKDNPYQIPTEIKDEIDPPALSPVSEVRIDKAERVYFWLQKGGRIVLTEERSKQFVLELTETGILDFERESNVAIHSTSIWLTVNNKSKKYQIGVTPEFDIDPIDIYWAFSQMCELMQDPYWLQ